MFGSRTGGSGAATFFKGNIDETRIYNTFLSSQEIETTYNNQSAVLEFLTFGSEETEEVPTPSGDIKQSEFWFN